MNVKEYESIISKTAVFPEKVEDFGKAYSFLGLIDELGEFLDALLHHGEEGGEESLKALKKEAGDAYWYITSGCHAFGVDTQNVITINNKQDTAMSGTVIGSDIQISLINLFPTLSTYAGALKKYYRDGKELPNMTSFFKDIERILSKALTFYNIDVSEVLEMNYNKLIKRRETNTLHGDGDNREDESI